MIVKDIAEMEPSSCNFQRLLATLYQICWQPSIKFVEGARANGSLLTNPSEGCDILCKRRILVSGLPIPADNLPEAFDDPLE
jgi:hypothetical protein